MRRQMRKRVLQALIVVGLIGILGVAGLVHALIVRGEERRAKEQELAAQLAEERAAAAWEALEEEHPEIHIGCASTVEDVIAMGTQIEITLPPVEVVEILEPAMGAVYMSEGQEDLPLVAIDAGHLGYTSQNYKNTGAQSVFGTIEHEWALQVAWVLKDELIERGYDVYMVRDTDDWDVYPYDNGERTEAVNALECDILVAIHWDSFDMASVDGYHAIYKGNGQTPNYRLAKAISDCYGDGINFGVPKFSEPVARDDLWQLNVATMPAVILECGFSSNESDAKFLEKAENHLLMAEGIADGIDQYFAGESAREEAEKESEEKTKENTGKSVVKK